MAVTDRQLTKSKLRDSDSAKPYFEKKAHCLQGARSTRASDTITSQGEECGRLQEQVDLLQEASDVSVMQLQNEKSALQTDLSASRDACDDRAGQVDRLITVNADLRTERG
ncbi:hypothetical protein PC119_g22634 [Phytophthora cactorum]|nr:hypothetical protein PC119_g22634 [Phytophthora cactorum]